MTVLLRHDWLQVMAAATVVPEFQAATSTTTNIKGDTLQHEYQHREEQKFSHCNFIAIPGKTRN
jgi:hypothetical protein